MSRIGRKPIKIPDGTKVEVSGRKVTVKGSKGELSFSVEPGIKVTVKDSSVEVASQEIKRLIPFWGTTRAVIANMIQGVSEGYTKKLELVGVGYRVKQESPRKISLTLGFSHPVVFEAAEGIEIKVEDNQHLTIEGIDKHLVGQTAAKIRALRKPEPYKGKGIRYPDEIVRRKPGKAGKVGAGTGSGV